MWCAKVYKETVAELEMGLVHLTRSPVVHSLAVFSGCIVPHSLQDKELTAGDYRFLNAMQAAH